MSVLSQYRTRGSTGTRRESSRPADAPARVTESLTAKAHPSRKPDSSRDAGAVTKPPQSLVGNGQGARHIAQSGTQDKVAPAKLKPLDIAVPDQIDRYSIGRRIGSGTCGVVHQALDNLLGREVAIKLSPIGEPHVSTGKVPGAQRAYQTEIIAAGKLTHGNIVTVYDAGQFEELNYLVMEVIEGVSLKEYGKGKARLPVHRALSVVVDCCLALDYSHAQGILHRDIKPANIMLANNGAVKLLDFGIAVGLRDDAALEKKGPTLGTPNYMSPEQILGRDLDAASDFYSLATVLFELLTGRQLFKARKVKDLFRTVVHQEAPRLHDIRPDLPPELSEVLAKALEKNPRNRYQNGREMAAAIEPFITQFRIVEERPPAQQRFIRELKSQVFFSTFSDVEIAQLLELVKVQSFIPGELLVTAGSVDRRLLILTDGLVRVEENGDLISVYGEGECVGELGFINGAPEARQMRALTAVNALELSADALSELPPKVHLHYYRYISDVLVERLASAGQLQLDYTL